MDRDTDPLDRSFPLGLQFLFEADECSEAQEDTRKKPGSGSLETALPSLEPKYLLRILKAIPSSPIAVWEKEPYNSLSSMSSSRKWVEPWEEGPVLSCGPRGLQCPDYGMIYAASDSLLCKHYSLFPRDLDALPRTSTKKLGDSTCRAQNFKMLSAHRHLISPA